MKAALSGVAQQGLGDKHVLMDAHRIVALSSFMVAMKACLNGSTRLSLPKMGW
jgi:hypothetical protein